MIPAGIFQGWYLVNDPRGHFPGVIHLENDTRPRAGYTRGHFPAPRVGDTRGHFLGRGTPAGIFQTAHPRASIFQSEQGGGQRFLTKPRPGRCIGVVSSASVVVFLSPRTLAAYVAVTLLRTFYKKTFALRRSVLPDDFRHKNPSGPGSCKRM